MYALAEALATTIPVVTVLVNGGPLARDEVLRSVRQGWPIIVVQGSGRLADDIATLWQEKPSFILDPVLAEIIADGAIHLFPLHGAVAALEDLLTRQLRGDTTIKLAWARFVLYDTNAIRHQTRFRTLQWWILVLGVLGIALALTQTTLLQKAPEGYFGMRLLHAVIVIVPIAITVLVAAASRFGPVTARIRILPVRCSSSSCPVTPGVPNGICPAIRSVITGPVPRYGTCTMSGVLVSDLNNSPVKC